MEADYATLLVEARNFAAEGRAESCVAVLDGLIQSLARPVKKPTRQLGTTGLGKIRQLNDASARVILSFPWLREFCTARGMDASLLERGLVNRIDVNTILCQYVRVNNLQLSDQKKVFALDRTLLQLFEGGETAVPSLLEGRCDFQSMQKLLHLLFVPQVSEKLLKKLALPAGTSCAELVASVRGCGDMSSGPVLLDAATAEIVGAREGDAYRLHRVIPYKIDGPVECCRSALNGISLNENVVSH